MAWVGDGPKIGRMGFGFQAARAAGAPYRQVISTGAMAVRQRNKREEDAEMAAEAAYLMTVLADARQIGATLRKQGASPDEIVAALWIEADKLGLGREEYLWKLEIDACDDRAPDVIQKQWIALAPSGLSALLGGEEVSREGAKSAILSGLADFESGYWVATSEIGRFIIAVSPRIREVCKVGSPPGEFWRARAAFRAQERRALNDSVKKLSLP